jgi:ribosomal-protein-alanine N-acetyltransferase
MIRHWQPEDIPQIVVIEEQTQIAPWSVETFQKCFLSHYQGWVIEEDDEKISGFAVVSLQMGECHVLNICIKPPFQHQGAGIAYLEVRCSNSHAIRMYQRMGFSEVGQRKAYYPGIKEREDALVLALDLVNML